MQQKTYYPKAAEIQRDWVVLDAEGQNLGRFAARIAHILLGKHKPTFTPGVEMGDFVVVVNTEKVTVTGTRTSSNASAQPHGTFYAQAFEDLCRSQSSAPGSNPESFGIKR